MAIRHSPRLSTQTVKVLGALMARLGAGMAGSDIATVTKLPPGTLYPILNRLAQAGWLKSKWEFEDPRKLGRPRRRVYQMTAQGIEKTRLALEDGKSTLAEFA